MSIPKFAINCHPGAQQGVRLAMDEWIGSNQNFITSEILPEMTGKYSMRSPDSGTQSFPLGAKRACQSMDGKTVSACWKELSCARLTIVSWVFVGKVEPGNRRNTIPQISQRRKGKLSCDALDELD